MRYLIPLLFSFSFIAFSFGSTRDSITSLVENYHNSQNPVHTEFDVLLSTIVQNVQVYCGENETYFMTGTTGDVNGVQDGIRVWASKDLKQWNLVGRNDGCVWKFDDDGDRWQKEISDFDGWKKRGAMAPELFAVRDTFYLTFSNSNADSLVLLKSLTGKIYGPYDKVGNDNLGQGSAPSVFTDNEQNAYLIWDPGKIQRLSRNLGRFDTFEAKRFYDEAGNVLELENSSLDYIDSTYYLTGSQRNRNGLDLHESYDGVIMTSKNLLGPYKEKLLISNAGGGDFFKGFDGAFYYAYGNSEMNNPLTNLPGIVRIQKTDEGGLKLFENELIRPDKADQVIYVSVIGNNSSGDSWDDAYSSIQRAIDNAPDGSQIWVAGGNYDGPISVNLRKGIYIYGGFRGDEVELDDRDIEKYKVVINGRNSIRNVFSIKSSQYIRLDGVTIRGGNAKGGSLYMQYGGGMHVLGGGSTIRIVNCSFEGNSASQDGGALYVSNGASPVLIACDFKNNVARKNGGAIAFFGNRPNGFSLQIINCTFDDNFAYGEGSAVYFDSRKRGYGLLEMDNCLIINNTSLGESGVLFLDGYASLALKNSTVCYNKGTTQGAVIGRMGAVPAKTRIVNCIFYKNYGGILFAIEGEAEVLSQSKEKLVYKNIWFQMKNCLFNDNQVNALVQRNFDSKRWTGVDLLNQSIICESCITGDPSFKDAVNGDFRLMEDSRALNKGTLTGLLHFDIEGKIRRNTVNLGCY